jgi:hypothetical protein
VEARSAPGPSKNALLEGLQKKHEKSMKNDMQNEGI